MRFVVKGSDWTKDEPIEASLTVSPVGTLHLFLGECHVLSITHEGELITTAVSPDIGESGHKHIVKL